MWPFRYGLMGMARPQRPKATVSSASSSVWLDTQGQPFPRSSRSWQCRACHRTERRPSPLGEPWPSGSGRSRGYAFEQPAIAGDVRRHHRQGIKLGAAAIKADNFPQSAQMVTVVMRLDRHGASTRTSVGGRRIGHNRTTPAWAKSACISSPGPPAPHPCWPRAVQQRCRQFQIAPDDRRRPRSTTRRCATSHAA